MYDLFKKYGWFLLAGPIGAIITRLRTKNMKRSAFFVLLIVASFVGFCVGVLMTNFFNFPEEVVFIFCSIGGMLATEILDELKESVEYFSEWVRKILNLK